MTVTEKTTEKRQVRDWRAREDCEKARHLERAGDYDGARRALGKLWSRIGDRPQVEWLPADTRAEVLLRAGALSGWLGSTLQIAGAQEFARDLITESIELFESIAQSDKVAEAQTDLALCYWRSGALDEGRILFKEALNRAELPATKLRALTSASTVEISSGRYLQAQSLLNLAAALLPEVSDEMIHGPYHLQRALVYRNLDGAENMDHALVEYSAASMSFANAGAQRYLARVENNIGFILLHLKRFNEALEHLEKARSIFVSLKDVGRVAQVNETRARVFIAKKQFAAAERAAFAAITTLEQGDEHSLLAEALTTQAVAFARSAKNSDALKAFERAVEVATVAGDPRSAAIAQLTKIEEMKNVIPAGELLTSFRMADQFLGEHATSMDLQQLRRCAGIVIDAKEHLQRLTDEELVGGTLEQEMFYFEAKLIRRALDQANGSVTRAARLLGVTHQGLCYILEGRHKKTLGRARREKRVRRKSIITKQ